jgi:hypothetical protein
VAHLCLKGQPSQRPIRFTQVLVGRPTNDLLKHGPFTADRQIGPVNCPLSLWAHYGPVSFRPVKSPDVEMGPFQPGVPFGLLTRVAHGPYMV